MESPIPLLKIDQGSPILSMVISQDGKYLISGLSNAIITVRDAEDGSNIKNFLGHEGAVNSVAISPDGKFVASGSSDKTLRLWEFETGRQSWVYQSLEMLFAVTFSRNGNHVFMGSGKEIFMYSVEGGKHIRTFSGHKSAIFTLAISSDGNYLISGSADNSINFWEINTAELVRTLTHDGWVRTLAISPDGNLIASGSSDNTIKLWEYSTGTLLKTYTGHSNIVFSVVFSPNNRYIVSASEDLTTKIWDVRSTNVLYTLRGHIGGVFSVVITKDGKYFYSSSEDNNLIKWDFPKKKELTINDEQTMDNMKMQEKRIDLYKKINKIGLKIAQGAYLEAAKRLKKIIEKAKSYNLDDVVSVAESIYQANKSILDTLSVETTHDMGLIEKLEIPTSKIFYDNKSMRLSFNLPYFTYIGHYKKSTTFEEVLDEFYTSLGETKIKRKDVYIYDSLNEKKVKDSEKIKKLILLNEEERDSKKEREKLVGVLTEKGLKLRDEGRLDEFKDQLTRTERRLEEITEPVVEAEMEDYDDGFRIVSQEKIQSIQSEKQDRGKSKKRKMGMAQSYDRPIPKSAPPPMGAPGKPSSPTAGASFSEVSSSSAPPPAPASMEMKKEIVTGDMMLEEEGEPMTMGTPKETTYDINMGLQYYATMMESKSYLFYVYFSHEELKIEDEEGKTVYKTTFQIVTTKEEPPQLDLRIEGIGFEIHPLSGVIEVKKDAINPPIMIFSILPTKSRKKQSKKEEKAGEKRFLNIYIDFEGKNVSHTILSILIQPKHFSLDLGPIHMNLSKGQALIVSFIPVFITVISTLYALTKIELTGGSSADALGGIIPGAGSVVFLLTFLVTLLRKGVFPMKQKVTGFLDFDKGGMMK